MIQNTTSQAPRVFYCRHMQPGLAEYENERILVDSEGMKNLIASGAGIPVYIHHQDVDYKNLKEDMAGVVSDSFYNELDGYAWFKFVAIDDSAHAAIQKGWSVSNAYRPTNFGPGGKKNNCTFDREVKNGKFTHLAIVPNPRYEDSLIMSPEEFKNYQENLRTKHKELQNSIENSNPKGKSMLKFFKTEKKEVTSVDADTQIEIGGKTVTIAEMVNAVTAAEQEAAQTVEVNGKKITITELAAAYENAMKKNGKKAMKKNESPKKEMEETEDCENESDEEEEEEADKDEKNKKIGPDKENKKEKKNGKKAMKKNGDDDMEEDMTNSTDENKFFHELRNAHLKTEATAPMIETSIDALARGKQRYGSGK